MAVILWSWDKHVLKMMEQKDFRICWDYDYIMELSFQSWTDYIHT